MAELFHLEILFSCKEEILVLINPFLSSSHLRWLVLKSGRDFLSEKPALGQSWLEPLRLALSEILSQIAQIIPPLHDRKTGETWNYTFLSKWLQVKSTKTDLNYLDAEKYLVSNEYDGLILMMMIKSAPSVFNLRNSDRLENWLLSFDHRHPFVIWFNIIVISLLMWSGVDGGWFCSSADNRLWLRHCLLNSTPASLLLLLLELLHRAL